MPTRAIFYWIIALVLFVGACAGLWICLGVYWAFTFILLMSAALAIWKGSPAERWGGILILAIAFIGRLADLVIPHDARPILYLVEDGLTAVCLLAVAIRYASFWLGGAMLIYAALFTLHAAYFVLDRRPDPMFIFINNYAFLGVILCLGLGTAVSWRARAKAQTAATA